MPWKTTKPVEDLRREFVARVLSHEKSKSALCREYGISRVTGDKWLRRWRDGGDLADRSHAPRSARRVDKAQEEMVLSYRGKYPVLGARKLHFLMLRNGEGDVPCARTVNAILKRNGALDARAAAAARRYERFEKAEPNDMWQMDYKGWFRMAGGQKCHPLNVIDDHSRFCVRSVALPSQTLELALPVLLGAFAEYGLPRSILCDNGAPWGSSQAGGFTQFEVAMMELGVLTLHGRAYHPQTQGKMERLNGSMKRELLSRLDAGALDLAGVQSALDAYRDFYNNERPHEALGLDCPAAHYRPSARRYRAGAPVVKDWDYPRGFLVRTVKHNGFVRFKGREIFFSEAFEGKRVAFRESRKAGCVTFYFREFKLGRYNCEEGRYEKRGIWLADGDPRYEK